MVVERDFDLRERLERATPGGDRDGVYRAPVASHRAGPAYADAAVLLDWHGDGRGYGRHDVKESPTV
ncbi:hypothetical protein [Streptomyces sp. NPDC058401]|uniref:hypothetical protein n=1 Tax=Streptomyces sp. NPDC058401 TaxID=3346480 RepID=UPI003657C136